jgi:DNA-binding response OmpR family regulator
MSNEGTSPVPAGRRVLIVEDEALVAMELEALLRQAGWDVLGPVGRVDMALALIDQQRPDAALLDLNLQGETALPVALALKAKDVPFVILSGYNRSQDDAPELRDAPRMSKPIMHRSLIQLLTTQLR